MEKMQDSNVFCNEKRKKDEQWLFRHVIRCTLLAWILAMAVLGFFENAENMVSSSLLFASYGAVFPGFIGGILFLYRND